MSIQGDFILVLCHFLREDGSLRDEFKVRLNMAARTYFQNPTLTIVINGGLTKGTPRSQGQAAYDYLRHLRVPEENILWGEEGHDTFAELNLARAIMEEHGWHHPIVVTNGLQLMQVRAVFWCYAINWSPLATPRYERSLVYVIQRFIAAGLALIFPDGNIPVLRAMRWSRENKLGQKF